MHDSFPKTDVLYAVSERSDGNMSFAHGGHDEVILNRRAFLARHGLQLEGCVMPDLEHADTITLVDAQHRGIGMMDATPALAADALITNTPGLALALFTADCFPVAYYDPKQHAIGLAHLGWRPAGKLLARAVVEHMASEFGSKPSDIHVRIGPGIHPDSYKKTELQQKDDPLWQPYLHAIPDSDETSIDLLGFVRDQVRNTGAPDTHITISTTDTATDERMFSHDRTKRTGEPEGRFMTVLALR